MARRRHTHRDTVSGAVCEAKAVRESLNEASREAARTAAITCCARAATRGLARHLLPTAATTSSTTTTTTAAAAAERVGGEAFGAKEEGAGKVGFGHIHARRYVVVVEAACHRGHVATQLALPVTVKLLHRPKPVPCLGLLRRAHLANAAPPCSRRDQPPRSFEAPSTHAAAPAAAASLRGPVVGLQLPVQKRV